MLLVGCRQGRVAPLRASAAATAAATATAAAAIIVVDPSSFAVDPQPIDCPKHPFTKATDAVTVRHWAGSWRWTS